MTLLGLARILTEANRALSRELGEQSSFSFDEQSQDMRQSIYSGILNVLNGIIRTPKDSHDIWMATRLKTGWTYGPIKDINLKKSPCLVEFDDLPVEQKVKDTLFIEIIKALEPIIERKEV